MNLRLFSFFSCLFLTAAFLSILKPPLLGTFENKVFSLWTSNSIDRSPFCFFKLYPNLIILLLIIIVSIAFLNYIIIKETLK